MSVLKAPAEKPKRTRATGKSWRKPFLSMLEKTGIVSLSAKSAAVTVRMVYRTAERSAAFRRQMQDARDKAVDAMEAAALLRATQGIEEPVWMKDENGKPIKVDTFRRYSDTLLIFLLKANRPAKYRETYRAEISGPDGAPIKTEGRDTIIVWPHELLGGKPTNGDGQQRIIDIGEAHGELGDAQPDRSSGAASDADQGPEQSS